MAGVPATIAFDETLNQRAQQAAMLMSANGQINHAPPSTWSCYSASAADAAGKSNLGLGINGPDAVEGYVAEPGASNSSVGHRRWLLHPQTRFGHRRCRRHDGTPDPHECAVGDRPMRPAHARRCATISWPAAAHNCSVPDGLPALVAWYPRADFSAATVTMTENGQPIATRRTCRHRFRQHAGLDSWIVDGMRWAMPSADTLYQVTVANVDGRVRSFTYAVTVFDPVCLRPPVPQIDAGRTERQQAGAHTFTTLAGVSQYQWRSLSVAPFSLNDGADPVRPRLDRPAPATTRSTARRWPAEPARITWPTPGQPIRRCC
jgi:hypothetical protein